MADQIEFTDRYQALGIPYPDPETMCHGQCEGTGFYPIFEQRNGEKHGVHPTKENTAFEKVAWRECHREGHGLWQRIKHAWEFKNLSILKDSARNCDGWHFIKCLDCGGTGKGPNDG